jgi:DNA-binding NtrC family response regulator
MARVLVIDDDEDMRSLFRAKLEQAGHSIVLTESGSRAIDLHAADPADVVITDLVMPGETGMATIMGLRRGDPAVKIIAISGSPNISRDDYLDVARALGAKRTFTKPFDWEEMLSTIDRLACESA